MWNPEGGSIMKSVLIIFSETAKQIDALINNNCFLALLYPLLDTENAVYDAEKMSLNEVMY